MAYVIAGIAVVIGFGLGLVTMGLLACASQRDTYPATPDLNG